MQRQGSLEISWNGARKRREFDFEFGSREEEYWEPSAFFLFLAKLGCLLIPVVLVVTFRK